MHLVLFLVAALMACTALLVQATTLPVNENQLQFWQDLYDFTDGPSWTACSDARDAPCTCLGTVNAYVSCSTKELGLINYIDGIYLRDNNLAANFFPDEPISAIIEGSLAKPFTLIDLTDNPKLHNFPACIRIRSCNANICKFDKPLCTSAPTPPSPTAKATKSPTIKTTKSPTIKVTKSPSVLPTRKITKLPTTKATKSPSNLPTVKTTTKAPTALTTVPSSTSKAPSFSPTIPLSSFAPTTSRAPSSTVSVAPSIHVTPTPSRAPSSTVTVAPSLPIGSLTPTTANTSAPATGAPTGSGAPTSVGTQSQAPTGSMASSINGFIISVFVSVITLMMI